MMIGLSSSTGQGREGLGWAGEAVVDQSRLRNR